MTGALIASGVAFLARRVKSRGVARTALATALAGVLLAGCSGIKAPDLFIVQRSGSGPHAKLTLLVNEEGGVHCNGVGIRNGAKLKLSDPQLVQARAIQEELEEPSAKHTVLAAGAKSVLRYFVRDEHGYVRFSDDSAGQPKVLRNLQLFVLQVSQSVCGLPE